MALVKCSECGKDISTQATACPHCGCPLAAAPPGPGAPPSSPDSPQATNTPAGGSKKPAKGCAGCLGLVAIFIVVFWIADFAGCQWTKNGLTSSPSAAAKVTKAELRNRLRNNFPGLGIGQIVLATQFKSAMGEPTRTQAMGNQAYWYYDCADGAIQVVLDDPNMFGNMACIKDVNEY